MKSLKFILAALFLMGVCFNVASANTSCLHPTSKIVSSYPKSEANVEMKAVTASIMYVSIETSNNVFSENLSTNSPELSNCYISNYLRVANPLDLKPIDRIVWMLNFNSNYKNTINQISKYSIKLPYSQCLKDPDRETVSANTYTAFTKYPNFVYLTFKRC